MNFQDVVSYFSLIVIVLISCTLLIPFFLWLWIGIGTKAYYTAKHDAMEAFYEKGKRKLKRQGQNGR